MIPPWDHNPDISESSDCTFQQLTGLDGGEEPGIGACQLCPTVFLAQTNKSYAVRIAEQTQSAWVRSFMETGAACATYQRDLRILPSRRMYLSQLRFCQMAERSR